tara:strand:+ start:150 stop:302 length:153 start_codon:yes stop_codon:yes gene_type:complete
MNKLHALDNEIFNHYRLKQIEINKAIELLKENNYKIIDMADIDVSKPKNI